VHPIIISNARRHGIADAEIVHAFTCAIDRFPGDEGLLMLIGPSRNAGLLKIGAVTGESGLVSSTR
jgi:hypothetical protein